MDEPPSSGTAQAGPSAAASQGARLHGRDPELAALLQALGSLRREPRLHAVTLVAEAGVGKSRLLQAFSDACAAENALGVWHRGRALPSTRNQPFGLLRDILTSWCTWTDLEALASTRTRFELAMQTVLGPMDAVDAASAAVHCLGYLIGLGYADSPHVQNFRSDPKQIREQGLEAARRLLLRPGTGDAPSLLQIEDLHWADNESLDFLQTLFDSVSTAPMLVLCSARPALLERRPGWGATKDGPVQEPVHRRLTLTPLDRAASRGLADELLNQLPSIPPALRELVAGGAQGNPFHMEQLVGLLTDAGVLRQTGGAWSVDAERLLATPWPSTLTGVLQARLAALPAAQRRALRQASVIGPDFSGDALLALGGPSSLSLPASLTRELTREVTPDVHRQASADPRRDFSFRHQVLQQVTYNSIPSRSRRALHKRLALWLSGLVGVAGGHALGATADHFEQAGEVVQAAEYHAQAAEHAADRYAHEASLAHVERALALLDAESPQAGKAALHWRLLDRRELTFATLAQRPEQRKALDAMAAFADTTGDVRLRAEAACRLANFYSHIGDLHARSAASRRAMVLAEQAGDQATYLRALRELSDTQCRLGDWDAGQRLAQQCLELAAAQNNLYAQAQCLVTLSVIAAQRLDPVGRVQAHERELSLRKQLPDRRPEAVVLANLGGGWLDLGELFLARRYSEEALRLLRSMGNRQTESTVLCNLSNLERWLGDGQKALALAEAALAAATDAGSPPWEAFALTRVADSHVALGQWSEASQAYGKAQALAIQLKMPHQHETTAGLARVALAQGDFPTALQHVQRVFDHEAATGARHGAKNAVRVDLVCHLVLASADDPRASAWLQRAHGQLEDAAARITDPALRRGYLGNIPEHRAVTAAWAAAQAEASQLGLSKH